MRPRILLAAASSFSLMVSLSPAPTSAQVDPVRPYRDGDRSTVAMNILPPGQGRYLDGAEFLEHQGGSSPDELTDQLEMYASLVQSAPGLTRSTLTDHFKDASFGVAPGDEGRTYSPRDGVTVIRDESFNVPHVYGTTRSDTMFGAGYVSAEDRLFMMDALRHFGRGRLSEFLGPSEANIASDCAQYRVADYTDQELVEMVENRPAGTDQALAEQSLQDVRDYVDGINAYIDAVTATPSRLPAEYPALNRMPREWTISDTVAVASLIGGQLGVGGGGEIGNALFMNALVGEGYTEAEARQILADLRLVDDPEAPSSTAERFAYDVDLGAVDPDSVAIPDAEPISNDEAVPDSCTGVTTPPFPTADGPLGPIPLAFPSEMSNALLVGSDLSASGEPMAVFGPQVAYYSPQILMELDLHGPGIHARGVGFPGISLYVLLGRGDGYGFSATSASGDQVDIRAVKLCDPGGGTVTIESDGYITPEGDCEEIEERSDTWESTPTAASCPPGAVPPPDRGCAPELITMTTQRVRLEGLPGAEGLRGGNVGIVASRGLVDGTPVAFARQRVSYGGEVDSALAYVEMMDPDRINGAEDFQRAFGRFNFTFNWFYVDGEDVAFQLGGVHPVRARNIDPDLPVWNDTEWGWQRPLSFEETPKDISPPNGYITSWNNKQAPGFRAADNNWGFTAVDRVQPLDDRIEAATADDGAVDLVELVRAMGVAATVDLRGDKVLPLLLDVIGDAGSPELQDAVDLLEEWNGAGAHRRDLDGDGEYDHQAAVALMDEWWPLAVEAVFGDVLGPAFGALPYTLDDRADSPDHNGSSFNDGFYGHVSKDLRSILGRPVTGGFSRIYCGGGALADCRDDLIQSLQDAVDVAPGDHDESEDEIRFSPVGLVTIPSIPWQNRPTFQQVLQFSPSTGDSVPSCPGNAGPGLNHVVGTAQRDVLRGTPGRDVICGLSGNDHLLGRKANDILIGGAGRDRLRGQKGKDILRGGRGKDLLQGGPAKDRLRGGRGKDRLNGGPGKDRCGGGPGRDRGRRCERGRV